MFAMSDMPEPPWRTAPKRGRPVPRPQLSREVVVAAALKVIELDGGDALTMRRVADEIGVSASALYGYVANKEELIQLVLEQIIQEIRVPEGELAWPDVVKEFAREMLGIFKRHPGVAALTMGRVPFGPSMLAGSEYILSRLTGGRGARRGRRLRRRSRVALRRRDRLRAGGHADHRTW